MLPQDTYRVMVPGRTQFSLRATRFGAWLILCSPQRMKKKEEEEEEGEQEEGEEGRGKRERREEGGRGGGKGEED